MAKYLNAEFYKVTHRKTYLLGFLGTILGLIALFIGMMRANAGPNASFESFVSILAYAFSIGLYLVVTITDMVFSDQYKYNTLKNEVAFGLPRARIYLGKLITSALTAIVLCVILLGFYLGAARLFFPLAGNTGAVMRDFFIMVLASFPLWVGGLSFFLMLLFVMKGSTSATVLYVLVIAVFGGNALILLEWIVPDWQPVLEAIRTVMLTTPFDSFLHSSEPLSNVIPYAWAVGMGWTVLSTVIGLIVFQKREIS